MNEKGHPLNIFKTKSLNVRNFGLNSYETLKFHNLGKKLRFFKMYGHIS